MLFLNEKEEKIIKTFMSNQTNLDDEIMLLKWNNGSSVIAKYNCVIEDENDYEMDEPGYEEFWSFVFEMLEVSGEPPVCVTEHGCFLINYHNFPEEISLKGEKVN